MGLRDYGTTDYGTRERQDHYKTLKDWHAEKQKMEGGKRKNGRASYPSGSMIRTRAGSKCRLLWVASV